MDSQEESRSKRDTLEDDIFVQIFFGCEGRASSHDVLDFSGR